MNVGLHVVDDNHDAIWRAILGAVGPEAIWQVDCLDCRDDILSQGKMTGRVFLSALDQGDYVLFARLLHSEGLLDRKIETYPDYLASNCRCAVMCTDGDVFEVYSRDEALLDHIAIACAGMEKVEMILENTVARWDFRVY